MTMTYSNVRYADGSEEWIDADWNGQPIRFRNLAGVGHYDSVREAGITPVMPLVVLQDNLCRRVDDDAESVRMRYLTPGSGMAMVYQEKFAQAQAVNAMGETAANAMSQNDREAQFPTLSASVGLEAPSLWGCAQLVLGKYAAFAALSLGIERARLTAKAQIKSASNVQSVRAAYEAIAWPMP